MTNRTQILNELRETSPKLAAKDSSGNPYGVPAGYFDRLASEVLNRVKALKAGSATEELEALSPLLSNLPKNNPYQVPEGYFTELAENSTDGAKAIELVNEELENLSPLMNNLRHKILQIFQQHHAYEAFQ